MHKPFAITLDVGSSLANKTGSWRTERPRYVHRLPPCNDGCPTGENCQQWLYHAEGLSFEAIGDRLGVGRKAVRGLWARGLKSLKRTLDGPPGGSLRHHDAPPSRE